MVREVKLKVEQQELNSGVASIEIQRKAIQDSCLSIINISKNISHVLF